MDKHQVSPENAAMILDWIRTRGGIAIWESANLSNPGASWTCPVNDESGNPKSKPTWEAGKIERVITNPDEVEVVAPKVVKQFHVGVRMGSQGMMLKVTDAGSRRIEREVDKAREKYGEAWYEFDYSVQDAVILVPDKKIPLLEFVQEHANSL